MPNSTPTQKLPQQLVKYITISTIAAIGVWAVFQIIDVLWERVLVLGILTVAVILLMIGGKFVIEFISLVLGKIEKRLETLSHVLAERTVSQLENFVMRLWWGLTSQFQGKYYQDLYYTYRTYQTLGLKTPGTFIPDLDKVFVPLQVTSKSPEMISSAMIQKQVSAGNLRIWDFLAEIDKQTVYKRIVVLGAPGLGKTTMLKSLTLTYAQNTQRQQHRKAPKLIPIMLRIREIYEDIIDSNSLNLAQLVTKLVRTPESSLKLDPPPQWFEERLANGKCLVMLDGLDEVADETQRRQISKWVDKQMRFYPKTNFIVTSRPFGYRNAELKEARLCLEVQPYNLSQAEDYINKWYLQNEIMRQVRREDPGVREKAKKKANDLIGRIKIHSPLADMARNPLLLTMMATVHDNRGALPGSRRELYAEICEVLLLRRQDAKGIIDQKIQLTAEQKQSVLQVLALELMKRNTARFTFKMGEDLIRIQLAAVAGKKVSPEDFIKHSEQISGLLVEKELGHYEFAHLSFQEYLAAVQVKETGQEEILLANINNSWWREPIHLYVPGNDTTSLVRAALEKRTVVSLTIAYDCLKEGKSLDPEVRQQLEEMLEEGLDSADPEIRKLAAEVKLAKRLNNLRQIDDKRQIDLSYITCSEYQLFINEKLNVGKFFQPDHWRTHHFLPGAAAQPITGVRASDAKEFCEWLTQRGGSQEVRYRLPTLTEAEEPQVPKKLLGCWCQDEQKQKQVIAGIEPEQLQVWQNNLARELNADLKNIRTRVRAFARELARDLSLFFPQIGNLKTALSDSRANNPKTVSDLILAHNHILSHIRTLTLKLAHTGSLTRINNLDNDLVHAIDSVKDRFFVRDITTLKECASHLTHDLARAIDLANDLADAQKHINNLETNLKDILSCTHEFSSKLSHACQLASYLTTNLHPTRERQLKNELVHVRELIRRLANKLKHDLNRALADARKLHSILVKASDILSDLTDGRQLVSKLTDAHNDIARLSERLTPSKTLTITSYQTLFSNSGELANQVEDIHKLTRNFSRSWNGIPANDLAIRGDISCISYYFVLILDFSSKLSNIYKKASTNKKLLRAIDLNSQKCESLRDESTKWSNEALNSYTFFMLVRARREGRIPPYEGIRIVREKVEV